MSQGFIVGSGGGQRDGPVEDGTIVVSYPVGATCTVTDGSKTYTALDTSGAAAFIVEPGAWTVTATPAGDETPASQSVTVTAGEWVEVELSFTLWLYKNGNEYTELTGGWQARALPHKANTAAKAPTVMKNSDNMVIYHSQSSSASSGIVEVVNDIDLTKLSKLKAFFPRIVTTGPINTTYDNWLYLSVMPRTASGFESGAKAYDVWNAGAANSFDNVELEVDVSALSGGYDVAFGVRMYDGANGGQTFTANLKEVGGYK